MDGLAILDGFYRYKSSQIAEVDPESPLYAQMVEDEIFDKIFLDTYLSRFGTSIAECLNRKTPSPVSDVVRIILGNYKASGDAEDQSDKLDENIVDSSKGRPIETSPAMNTSDMGDVIVDNKMVSNVENNQGTNLTVDQQIELDDIDCKISKSEPISIPPNADASKPNRTENADSPGAEVADKSKIAIIQDVYGFIPALDSETSCKGNVIPVNAEDTKPGYTENADSQKAEVTDKAKIAMIPDVYGFIPALGKATSCKGSVIAKSPVKPTYVEDDDKVKPVGCFSGLKSSISKRLSRLREVFTRCYPRRRQASPKTVTARRKLAAGNKQITSPAEGPTPAPEPIDKAMQSTQSKSKDNARATPGSEPKFTEKALLSRESKTIDNGKALTDIYGYKPIIQTADSKTKLKTRSKPNTKPNQNSACVDLPDISGFKPKSSKPVCNSTNNKTLRKKTINGKTMVEVNITDTNGVPQGTAWVRDGACEMEVILAVAARVLGNMKI